LTPALGPARGKTRGGGRLPSTAATRAQRDTRNNNKSIFSSSLANEKQNYCLVLRRESRGVQCAVRSAKISVTPRPALVRRKPLEQEGPWESNAECSARCAAPAPKFSEGGLAARSSQ
jgi:hypothetical protein